MKNIYKEPILEVIIFENEDIVTASTGNILDIDTGGLEDGAE